MRKVFKALCALLEQFSPLPDVCRMHFQSYLRLLRRMASKFIIKVVNAIF